MTVRRGGGQRFCGQKRVPEGRRAGSGRPARGQPVAGRAQGRAPPRLPGGGPGEDREMIAAERGHREGVVEAAARARPGSGVLKVSSWLGEPP